ncbi:hypothetical protein [Puniceibacterium sediminis]|uniref:SNARE associated Golgi protein n=1 Tax=Puniceibacterium sediminis TaxID=1608407 RepID=A0A238XFK8_9RHOB|nr:hypothetical protein [Puniceibacterium sediminis]SNR57707.1 hypothetical protein SAMN06265370_11135 [Puniceibacterium sediminis]
MSLTALLRNLARLVVIGALVWMALHALDWLRMETGPAGMTALALLLLIYMLVLATPFMPGVEIGLAILAMKGADAAPFVWAATIVGLSLAWAFGRWLPTPWIISALRDLRLNGLADTVTRISGEPPELRLHYLCQRAPNWLGRILRDWRYVALALLMNLPGNAVVGGGGGLAMLAGLSRIFAPGATLLTFVIGTAPIPLLVWFFGPGILPWTV